MSEKISVSRQRAWLRVLTLAFAAFIFNTTEYIPVSLLSDIGASFNMDSPQAGVIMTVYAWIVAIMSLPLVLLTGKIDRRMLMLALFALFSFSHLLSFMAWSFDVLLLSRAGVALSHALFWSMTASLVIRLAPAGNRAQALGMIATASGLASVLGIPVGRIIGQMFGWRVTFLTIGVAAFVLMILFLKVMPRLKPEQNGTLKSVPDLFRNLPLISLFLLAVLIITAHYCAFTYIEPFVLQVAGLSHRFVTVLLLIFGLAGIGGSILFSKLGEKHLSAMLTGAIAVLTLCLVLFSHVTSDAISLVFICTLWGMAIMIIGTGIQMKVLTLSHRTADIAMAIYSGIFNIGIGMGALLGKTVSAEFKLSFVGYAGAGFGIASLALAVFSLRKWPSARHHEENIVNNLAD
ncbi:sugar transporter [Pantoea sp. YR343]|uniref:sugar transporter n=1 Tax=Pantoea sp. YR343 TaxID=1144341 RepID=UPI0002710DA7|nr:sugar transporter [Pantoea sp. YR343]KAJ9431837.1 sugar transporter [Pantoea sp. YR343]